MKKGKDRREVSVRGETYEKVKAHVEECKKNPDLEHLTVAGFIDTLCASFFARGGKDGRPAKKSAGSTRRKPPAKGNGAHHHADQDHRQVRF